MVCFISGLDSGNWNDYLATCDLASGFEVSKSIRRHLTPIETRVAKSAKWMDALIGGHNRRLVYEQANEFCTDTGGPGKRIYRNRTHQYLTRIAQWGMDTDESLVDIN